MPDNYRDYVDYIAYIAYRDGVPTIRPAPKDTKASMTDLADIVAMATDYIPLFAVPIPHTVQPIHSHPRRSIMEMRRKVKHIASRKGRVT